MQSIERAIGEYALSIHSESKPDISISGEPKAYKMCEATLVALDHNEWNVVWKQHMHFRDEVWKTKDPLLAHHIFITYMRQMHHKLRLVGLERRLVSMEQID